jgi:hypothetical protein
MVQIFRQKLVMNRSRTHSFLIHSKNYVQSVLFKGKKKNTVIPEKFLSGS